jgi:dihydrolipoamide dehydrogenase
MVMGDLVREVDVAVVGGGPGGYSAAFRCAELGLETVVVDAGRRLGGVCLFEGCIPSKALLHVAALMHDVERAREFGVDWGEPKISLDVLQKWKADQVVGKLARGLAGVSKQKGVEVIGGRAVFEDSRGLRVEGDEPQKIRFKHAVVATGSLPAMLPGVTRTSERLMDSTSALEVEAVPERLLVIGGGYIGLEVGTVYAALGSQVTLVEMTGGLLPGVDRDLVRPLARRVEKLFAAIHLKSRVTAVRETGPHVEVEIEGRGMERFDRVLVAVGRRPRSADIGLDATRARLDDRGAIVIDEQCRTADAHLFAVGDVTGEPMLAHRAMRQGKVVAEVIAGHAAAFDNVAVPAVVFTDPEIGWCGLTETDANAAGRPVKVARFQWAGSGRAATLGRSDGMTKLVVDPESGRVLGAGVVGPGAAELIAEATLAVETAALAEDLAATIHVHPTLAEGWMESAEMLLRENARPREG